VIQNERLRALLAEARETLRDFAENWDCDKYGTTCRVCESQEVQQQIDAALAEPPSPVERENARLDVMWQEMVRERDEARAEVERLRWGNEMSCENTPNPVCQCAGCEIARDRADRGETGP